MANLEQNLEGIQHFHRTQAREANDLHEAAVAASAIPFRAATEAERTALISAMHKRSESVNTYLARTTPGRLWMLVMLVTCVEVYLQDVLAAAAKIDPRLMSKSEQCASYATVIGAMSLEDLANNLRARWARKWLGKGGPTRWICRLESMGATGYPKDLAGRLEPFWGMRHIVVHAAGVATAEFVRRHPGVVAARGDRLSVSSKDTIAFLKAIGALVDPTEAFFLARYPILGKSEPDAA